MNSNPGPIRNLGTLPVSPCLRPKLTNIPTVWRSSRAPRHTPPSARLPRLPQPRPRQRLLARPLPPRVVLPRSPRPPTPPLRSPRPRHTPPRRSLLPQKWRGHWRKSRRRWQHRQRFQPQQQCHSISRARLLLLRRRRRSHHTPLHQRHAGVLTHLQRRRVARARARTHHGQLGPVLPVGARVVV